MRNAPFFTDDTIVFGILMLLLGFVFYTSGKEQGFWKKFYGIVPALLMCYLLPAILNLMNNAIRATKANNSLAIALTSQVVENSWQMIIRDFGLGFTLSKLAELGVKPVASEQGLGMAVFLSHVSLERLGGKLALTNHQEGGALVTLSLPLESKG